MARTCTLIVLALTLLSGSAHASEKGDLIPGTENWHRYRFHVLTPALGEIAVQQTVAVQWDAPGAAIVLAIYDTSDPLSPEVMALSTGDDRRVTINVGLMDGTYQIIVAGVLEPTHYHMNVTYSRDELLFRQPNGPFLTAAAESADLRIEESLAPYVARAAAAMSE